MSAIESRRLPTADVVKRCSESEVERRTSDPSVNEKLFLGLGQDRFEHALALCMETNDPLHNMHAVDLSGAAGFGVLEGKIEQLLKDRKLSDPEDVCYFYNFDDPHQPLSYKLKKGSGKKFRNTLARILSELRRIVPDELSGARVEELKKQARAPFEAWMRVVDEKVRAFAKTHGFFPRGELSRMEFTPLESLFNEIQGGEGPHDHSNAKAVSDEQLEKLTPEQGEALEQKLHAFMRAYEDWYRRENLQQEMRRRKLEADRLIQAAEYTAAKETIEAVFQTWWPEEKGPPDFRAKLLEYTLGIYHNFGREEQRKMRGEQQESSEEPFLPFVVKVFVDHTNTKGIPIVAEPITTLGKAIGTISRGRPVQGYGYTVDHRNLSPGFFHMANGGYLILNAADVAGVPGLWACLKDMIRNQELSVAETPFNATFEVIRPEPISVSVKVIMFGPAWLIQLFSHADQEFSRLFKIRGEVLTKVRRTPEQIRAFRTWLDSFTREEGMHSLAPDGACAVIEYLQRLADDQDFIATNFEAAATLLQEAHALIDASSDEKISRSHVTAALDKSVWRNGVLQQRRLEFVQSGGLLIATEGKEVGQINGLVVSGAVEEKAQIESFCRTAAAPFNLPPEFASDFVERAGTLPIKTANMFGFPARITARASVGSFEIVNIHKEVKLAGPTFQKADLIVKGLIRAHYGDDEPLMAYVTYAFEQTSSPIDGDSASLAKFLVLTSALSGVPLRQDIAITGSVNQRGEVQPIGGVNEKCEGWFDVCATRPLSGKQGVVIPHQNAKNLMLRHDLVKAIEDKQFHIWAIKELSEAIEIFSGLTADEYHSKVKDGLKQLADKAKKFRKDQKTENPG